MGKVLTVLVRYLTMGILLLASLWIAKQYQPERGFLYYATAMGILVVLWCFLKILDYCLPRVWARFRGPSN